MTFLILRAVTVGSATTVSGQVRSQLTSRFYEKTVSPENRSDAARKGTLADVDGVCFAAV